ncbi:sushi-repeat-containing protein SRPX-like [Ruditapes philippinarum]|uniref:sushi-repeat-containing protein SRPX-like n=1 Tax=Ruditapes philippinarum TaxID=129788 RepID=UPI00295B6C90|nr:sushi-repeat-containing protein SRPX-like [Ruditapes philippinarum]
MCQVTKNETVFQYHCVEGSWKFSKGTDFHLRPKRFLGWIIAAVAAVAFVTIVVTFCYEKHGNMLCEEREERVIEEELIPPKYTVCPPPDIQSLYIAERKQTTVKVTWTDPTATYDKAVVSNKQTGGILKGNPFPGLHKEGLEHYITYTASDGRQSDTCYFSIRVKYFTCNDPPTPINGRRVLCTDGYIYGSECTFECFDGYETIGSATATCQQNETWDNTPMCRKVICNPPFFTTNGIVTCDDTKYEFDDDCLITCDDGFKLSGPSKMTCRADKTWSVKSSEVSCVDDDSPVISCLTPQVFYADRGTLNTSVTWIGPTATDNVDANPSILQTFGPAPESILSEGFHSVIFKVTDNAGNSFPALSECTIVLEIKVIKCSTGPTDALDNSRFMMYNCSDKSFYNGVSRLLDCDLNLPLNGTNLITCERDGNTDKGKWSWGSEHQPFCEVVQCPL